MKASSFGWKADDSTSALQAAFDSGARKVVVDRMEGDWITGPLFLRNPDQEIVLEDGVTVRAKKGLFRNISDCLFSIVGGGASNIVLRGEGKAIIAMNKKDYQDPAEYRPSEWRHAIAIKGARGVTVRDLAILSSGGDGVYVSAAARDVTLKNLECRDHHRQGVSVISAVNLLVSKCRFTDTSGTPPQCGVDVEPNRATDRLENVVFEDCEFDCNASSGIDLHLAALNEKTRPISVAFRRCLARNNANCGITMLVASRFGGKPSPVRGKVVFEDCRVSGNGRHAFLLTNQMSDALRVEVAGCVLDGRAGKTAAVRFNNSTLPADFGNIRFENVSVMHDGYPAVVFDSIPGAGIVPETVSGSMEIEKSGGTRTVLAMHDFAMRHKSNPEALKALLSFKTSAPDFRRCKPLSGGGPLAKPVSTGRLRRMFTFVQCFPCAGEYPIVFRAQRIRADRPVQSRVQVRDALGTDLGSFTVGDDAPVTHVIRAAGPGLQRFEVTTGGGTASVESRWPGHGIQADVPLFLFGGRNRRFYFMVPAAADDVRAEITPDEPCKARLLRPDGTAAAEMPTGTSMTLLEAARSRSSGAEMWCLDFTKLVEDARFRIGSPALPLVSTDPAAVITAE